MEYKTDGYKIDIYLDDIKQKIEVKTIKRMEVDKLYKKAIGVIDSSLDDSDILWIFYFYKISRLKSSNQPNISCHYLLVYININILEQESSTLRRDLIQMVEESKVAVSKKLNIRPTLIIPLENLVMVEDLERIVEEKDQQIKRIIEEKDQQIKRIIEEKDQQLEEKERIIQELRKKIK